MEKQVISRVAYCSDCAGVPNKIQKNRRIILFGRTTQQFFVRKINKIPKRGFTPHLFYLDEELEHGLLVVLFCCAVEGCGLRILRHRHKTDIDIMHIETEVFTKKKWKALVGFNNTGYEFT